MCIPGKSFSFVCSSFSFVSLEEEEDKEEEDKEGEDKEGGDVPLKAISLITCDAMA